MNPTTSTTRLLLTALGASLFVACGSSDSTTDGGVLYDLPQVLPDNNPICLSDRVIAVGETWNQPILLQNLGKQTLEISTASIANDLRHSFSLRGPDHSSIDSLDFATFELRYAPTEPGWDAIGVEIFSNAQNYPRLDVYVVARAVPPGLDGGTWDAGPRPPRAEDSCPSASMRDGGVDAGH